MNYRNPFLCGNLQWGIKFQPHKWLPVALPLFFLPAVVALCLFCLPSCSSNEVAGSESGPVSIDDTFDTPDWTEATHGKDADPDYTVVFAGDVVRRIDLVISNKNWEAMLDDMTDKYGPLGSGGGPPGDGEDPIWVPCEFYFNGIQWYKVGVRFKGSSSLAGTWGAGIMKLPLKFDFDEFEDVYPQIKNQRFYGFKKLSMANGFKDPSLIREKVVPEIFWAVGVPAARTAYYRVYIDHGEGPVYFGLYTMVEVVDDTVIKEQFNDDGGNLYKPEGLGASFAIGTFAPAFFEKKSNEDEADWSDILSLMEALHSDSRTENPAVWRSSLEGVFNVDGFLRWLAVNTVIQNWDTYGVMPHNYYLYNDPSTGLLTWIPWDNNEALKLEGGVVALSLALSEVNDGWPLIRYLIDDETYRTSYVAYLEQTIVDAFAVDKMAARYGDLHDLIQPYVTGTEGEIPGFTHLRWPGDFEAGLDYLMNHVNQRQIDTEYFLSIQR